jgi:hypothetical protein
LDARHNVALAELSADASTDPRDMRSAEERAAAILRPLLHLGGCDLHT